MYGGDGVGQEFGSQEVVAPLESWCNQRGYTSFILIYIYSIFISKINTYSAFHLEPWVLVSFF